MRRVGWESVVVAFLLSGLVGWALEWVPEQPKAPSKPPTSEPSVEQPSEAQPTSESQAQITWADSFDKAVAQSKAENKPLMIEFFVTYQQWCKMLDEKTLADPQIVDLSRQFVCVRVDGKDQAELAKKYGVKGYPATVFLNPQGEVVQRVIGFVPARPFELEMKPVAEGRNPEKEFQDLVKSNPTDFRPLVLLGIGYSKRQQYDKAIDAYEQALKVGPGFESKEQQEVVYSLCQLYDFKSQSGKSEKLLLELLNTSTADKVKVHDMLGQTYLSLKRPDDAVKQFQAERELVTDANQQKFLDQMIERIQKSGEKAPAPAAQRGV